MSFCSKFMKSGNSLWSRTHCPTCRSEMFGLPQTEESCMSGKRKPEDEDEDEDEDQHKRLGLPVEEKHKDLIQGLK